MNHSTVRPLGRRRFLGLSVATSAAAALAACSNTQVPAGNLSRVLSGDPVIAEYEARRFASGKTITQPPKATPFQTTIAGGARHHAERGMMGVFAYIT